MALQSVIAKGITHQLYRENREPTSLGPGLRRDDGRGAEVIQSALANQAFLA
jgi:hypothetical protein